MNNFFEQLENRIGFSRIGRINFSKSNKLHIRTPNIIIPIKNVLMKQFNFIREFENHDLFMISKEIFLKIGFLREKFKNTGFFFSYPGMMENFEVILRKNKNNFTEDNLVSIIPFNIPSTAIGKDFVKKEVKTYLNEAIKILKNYSEINFGLSVRLFDYYELMDLYIPIINENSNIKILNLVDIFDNFSNFRKIAQTILKIKTLVDNNMVIMASGRIVPKYFPILVYLGVDLVDGSYLLYLSADNLYDTIEYLLPIHKLKYLPCSCIACKGNLKDLINIKDSDERLDLLCIHNLIVAYNYMMKIKQYLRYEDYRGFVEKSSLDDTNLISLLKILDKDHFDILRFETPITQKVRKIKCFGPSSYNRPDFREFRQRITENFTPEPWTTVIIILPCSAKKPYSMSKSHKLFRGVISKFQEFTNFQEIILTSPLGAIPRQLENVYPVSSYDISVTGEWDDMERNITSEMLYQILIKYNENIPVICHLEKEYLEVAQKANSTLPHKFYFTDIKGKITSKESLQALSSILKQHINDYNPEKKLEAGTFIRDTWSRKFTKILDYQFGPESGVNIIRNELNPIKNNSKTKILLIDTKTNEKLGVYDASLGQIILTILGMERMIKSSFSANLNAIIFDGKELRGNTLFRQGIIEFSSELIPSNYAVIINKEKNEIIGAGKLIVGSNFIRNSKTGRVAEIVEKK
ncbi:MAG: DUF5591 domain-containing protein [Candidatus Thorarchaeota archaeon]